ncbi:RTA1 like protein-domain-containing protein [Pseudomassariella vexata]|uniref:RTA1 like protein-domain-containing protein n=1 Tax=Pseudomassariella vexata TaxID=1141098 RepID=A0A1Y2EEQ0_9PEZI|nr:RTA1 like protein-domain-containing protein [Pseudomassariella vexata]ORY70063.1 RTA1 like protein-domain-containing protein [Pseudomassariella vexata]
MSHRLLCFALRPVLSASIAFICLYFVAMCLHIALGILWESWWFWGCMIAGCIDEIIGYGGRTMLFYNPFSFPGFTTQIVCITTAPVFYCAAIYVTMAKLVENLDPSISRIKPRLYNWIFISCDIVSLVLQGVGGAMSTTNTGTSQVAVDLALAGLGFQVATLMIFCSLLVDYLVRYFQSSQSRAVSAVSGRLKTCLGFMGLAILLILARCAYRVDELSEGYLGALIHNEPLFIGPEGVLIICSVYALCIGHPGLIFNRTGAGKSSKGSLAEEVGVAGARK